MARYEKHARLLRQLAAMPAEARNYAAEIERKLVPILLVARQAPEPPRGAAALHGSSRLRPGGSLATR